MAIDIKAAVPTRAELDGLAKDLKERSRKDYLLSSNNKNLSQDTLTLHYGRAEAFRLSADLLNLLLSSAANQQHPEDNFEDSSNELDGGTLDDMPF